VLLTAKKVLFNEENRNIFFALMNAVETQVAAFHIVIFHPTSLFYCPVIGYRDYGKL
jgi:hypothetical protein